MILFVEQKAVEAPLSLWWIGNTPAEGSHGHPFPKCCVAKCVCAATQSCLTLCDPVDCSPAALLSTGFSRQEHWNGFPRPPPGGLPDPETEPASPEAPVLAGRFFTTEAPGKPEELVNVFNTHEQMISLSLFLWPTHSVNLVSLRDQEAH